MVVPRDSRLPQNEILDALFARVQKTLCATAPGPLPPGPAVSVPGSGEEGSLRPGEGSQVEEDWLREEKESLAMFTRRQFQALRERQAQIDSQRQELVSRQNELNEMCLLRQQDLNRQIKVLATRTASLEERERDLEDNEKKLTIEQQRLERARQDLNSCRREAAVEASELEDLKAEAERLLAEEHESRKQHVGEETALREGRHLLQAEQERFAERVKAFEQVEEQLSHDREEVDRLKSLLQREVAEQNLEQLQVEMEARRAHVATARAELALLAEAEDRAQRLLRHLEEAAEASRRVRREEEAEWESRREPMARRYTALEQTEAALERRAAELDRLEAQIQAELERGEQDLLRQREELEELREELRRGAEGVPVAQLA
jgi:DNA repair exonuclease SbcCD ATPase subunit